MLNDFSFVNLATTADNYITELGNSDSDRYFVAITIAIASSDSDSDELFCKNSDSDSEDLFPDSDFLLIFRYFFAIQNDQINEKVHACIEDFH